MREVVLKAFLCGIIIVIPKSSFCSLIICEAEGYLMCFDNVESSSKKPHHNNIM